MIIRKDSNNILFKDCRFVKKLKLRGESEKSRIHYCSNGDLLYLGEFFKYPEWKELYSGDNAGSTLYTKYTYDIEGEVQGFLGEYVIDEKLHDDEVVCFDTGLVKLVKQKRLFTVFQVVDDNYIEAVKNMRENDHISFLYKNFGEHSRIRAACANSSKNLYVEKFNKYMKQDKIIRKEIDYINGFAAYSPKNGKIVSDENNFEFEYGKVDRLLCTCSADKEYSAGECSYVNKVAVILKSDGYIYAEPFKVDCDIKNLNVVAAANRKLEVQYFDNQCSEWKILKDNAALNVRSGEEFKLRLKVEFADRIREVVLTDG